MNRLEALVKSLDPGIVVTIGIALFLSVLAAVRLARWYGSVPRQIHRLVRSISVDALVDVIIPDGMNGEIHIDHLLLTPRGLLLFEVKDVGGAVFAGDKLDVWTAVEPGNRLTFNNPLPPLQDRADALAWLAPGLPITSRVVFTRATFPKGHPDEVTTMDALREEFEAIRTSPDGADLDEIGSQWDLIKAAATVA